MTRGIRPPLLGPSSAAGDLVVPDGLDLDPLTVAHLARRLADAGPDVAAIVARPVVVPAGSSARVLAERSLASAASTALRASEGSRVRAAGLARPGSAVTVSPDGSTIEGAGVWIDPSAVAADLGAAASGPLVDADPTGRPLFTRRPVMVLALSQDAVQRDDDAPVRWATTLADELLALGTEARVAIDGSAPHSGSRPSTACALTSSTIAALRPDVIVTFDETARRLVEPWCTERYTLIVAVDPGLHDRIELVSWRHGRSDGRTRARVGPQVPAAALSALVARLCGGPPPVLPADIDAVIDQAVTVGATTRPAVRRRAAGPIRTVALVGTPAGPIDTLRWAGVADQFSLLGCTVTTDVDPGDLDRFDLVLCGGAVPAAGAEAVADRRRRGALCAALVGHHDVLVAADGTATLTDEAQALARAAGRALVPAEALARAGATTPIAPVEGSWRSRFLPSVLTGERIASLEAAGASRRAGTDPSIGWFLDHAADPTPHLEPLLAWLAAHPTGRLTVAAVGPLPAGLADHPGIRQVADLDPIDVAGWTAVVWSPVPGRSAGAGDVLSAVEVALVGVPILATDEDRHALGALGELVAPPAHEILTLGAADQRHRGRRLHDRAAALHGAQAGAVRAHRMLGWLLWDRDR